MAWNTPGGSGSDNDGSKRRGGSQRPAWRPGGGRGGGGGGPGEVFERVRGLFDGGGAGIGRWIVIALALFLAWSSFVLVGEQERGVVLRFGQYARVMQPGPNFKLPWPLEGVIKVNATGVRTYTNTVPVLTRDENIVIVSFNVQYRAGDPRQFLFGTRNAEEVLEQTALSTVREQIGRATLDTALNARGPLSVAAKTALQASLDAYRTGLVVSELNLQDARPPEEVKPAFDEVNSAQQTNERLVNEARAYAAKIVPEARGQAARVRAVSEGYKTAAIARATGDAERFTLLVNAYRNAPDVTRKRLWLDAVRDVLAGSRKVIGGDGRQLIYVPMTGAGQGGGASPPLLTPDIIAPPVSATPDESPARTPRPTRDGAER